MSSVKEAMRLVDGAYKYTRDTNKQRLNNGTVIPSDLLSYFKQPVAETRTAIRAADYMFTTLDLIHSKVHHRYKRSINATDLLSQSDLATIANITGCEAQTRPLTCSNDCWSNQYRTITGVCNNRQNPRSGAANTPFARWLPPKYEDGFFLPLGWTAGINVSGFPLPLVREVSNKIAHVSNRDVQPDRELSHAFIQWGQWIDHDLDFTPESASIKTFSDGIDCHSSCIQRNPCFPIKVPQNDSRIKNPNECIPFFRSSPVCGSGLLGSMFGGVTRREQMNSLTAYVDASMVYGSSNDKANRLRDLTTDLGLLRINRNFTDNGMAFLPFGNVQHMDPCISTRRSSGIPCFIAGDNRVSENPGLTSFHTLFVREHNRLATELKKLNPHWSGEIIYQETRKILGAYMQKITYQDFLPRVIGPEAMRTHLPTYKDYDDSVDASIANVFATAVFRFGHSMFQPFVFRSNETFQDHPRFPTILLHEGFFTSWRVIEEGGVDPIVRGLLSNPSKRNVQNNIMNEELRDRLFESINRLGLDLAALNLQRSRDHGIPGYNEWRKFCNLSQPRSLSDLATVLNNTDLARKLMELYGTPDNIDIWIAGVSEPLVNGGRVGPLFACLIGLQFKRLRNGDRFWWENIDVFTSQQRDTLQQSTLSRIICDNTRINTVPRDAFIFQSPQNYVKCSDIPRFNLNAWKEEDLPCGAPPAIANGSFTRCKLFVRYICSPGFTIMSSDTIICQSNRQWDRSPPTCTGTINLL
ncbi:myeloperoxidase [Protopterus annectens]|uniref:myeloperoxidase n=1 Tax=Protopterus annectens TaxID=7888 RepID=UPI001CF985A6|nr:myeloperoxidase [Protopterus annectens]